MRISEFYQRIYIQEYRKIKNNLEQLKLLKQDGSKEKHISFIVALSARPGSEYLKDEERLPLRV